MKGDKSLCKVVSYIKGTKTFIVQETASSIQGFLPLNNDSLNKKTEIFSALRSGKNIPLICTNTLADIPIYSANLETLDVKEKQEDSCTSISISFSSNDKSYNSSLFDTLLNLLGDSIDNSIKFNLAKQLLIANKELRIRPSLNKEIFYKCIGKYGIQLWKENLLPFTTNTTISNLWENGNETERQQLLNKLGISLPEPEVKAITKEIKVHIGSVIPLFDDIAKYIITEINNATDSIKIAVAWFTNFELFNCIKSALNRCINITLVTNNDLINNGGVCLNFNELIKSGLKMHLVEYPEMLHYKFCIIDDKTIITGSYNWTLYAEEINKEDVVVIKDLPEVTCSFINVFNSLTEQYALIDKMPDKVPNRPQYDRSLFKKYIDEELALRVKKNIGNRNEILKIVKDLYPENANVTQETSEFMCSNQQRTIKEIDQIVAQTAISERVQNRKKLQQEQTYASKQISNLSTQKVAIEQQRKELEQEKEQLSSSQDEKQRIITQTKIAQKEAKFNSQIKEISNKQRAAEGRLAKTNSQIQNINSEIDIIGKTSTIESIGGRGGLKITLKWTTTDDLDLHVFDPSSQEIYYSQKTQTCQGVTGRLDVDANAGSPYTVSPVENIYWEGTVPIGKYKVIVVLYSKRSSLSAIPFTVTIYPDKGISKVFAKEISSPKENVPIVEFIYSDNGIEYL